MRQYNIAVLVGSLRRDSYNQKLADALVKLGPPDFVFRCVPIRDLPLYCQDDEAEPAASIVRFREAIKAVHAVLFVSPEYNRSIPGGLKNAIDQGSRPYDKNVWAGKPAGMIGVSIGAVGTALAQQHLRNVLAFVDAVTLAQPEAFIQMREGLFDAAGNIGEGSRQFFQTWMDRYVAWVKKHV